MKTLRRPMFRKGGNVGDGIMTGIVDRSNYDVGSTNPALNVGEQDITDFISLVRGGGQDMSSDPATDFLLQFGPNLLTQTPQAFKFKDLYNLSCKQIIKVNDEATLFIENNYKIAFIKGEIKNKKITYFDDVEFNKVSFGIGFDAFGLVFGCF